MRPHRPVRRGAGERRVRAQLDAHLGWIHGWPTEGGWQVVPPPGRDAPAVISLDDAALGRAARCWSKTTGPYREAFARAVSDPEAWRTVVPARLTRARRLLQGDDHADAGDIDFVAATEAALAVRPERDEAVAWVRAHRAALETLADPVRVVQLAWLAVRHGAAVDPLLTLLTGDEPALATQDMPGRLKGALRPDVTEVPDLPTGRWKERRLLPYVDALWALPQRPRDLALRLLPLAWPLPLVAAWTAWWERAGRARRALLGVCAHEPGTARRAVEARARAALEDLGKPPPSPPDPALDAALVFARSEVEVAEGFAWFAASHGLTAPAELLDRWGGAVRRSPASARLLARVATDIARDPSLATCWPKASHYAIRWGPAATMDEAETASVTGWDAFLALRRMGKVTPSGYHTLAELLDLDAGTALARADALRRHDLLDGWPWHQTMKRAGRLARDDADAFARLVQLLSEDDAPEELAEHVGDPILALHEVVGLKPLVRASAHVGLARAVRMEVPPWRPPTAAPLPDALRRYPEALHDALGRLCDAHPDPVAAASAVLDRDLPPAAKLQRQIDALQQRDDPRLAARITRLQGWLDDPPVPTETRLVRLAGKLDDAALRAAFEAWTGELAARVRAARDARWGAQPDHDPERLSRILAGTARLAEPYRDLVDRLLRLRQGPRPWDLRDDPVHVALLEQWRSTGLDPAPWLDPPERTVDGLRLAVATDPLDALWMGAPFGTCLSPGAMNFFSAVTNAADVDKHVLLGWRDGRIVNRCLLAVTEQRGVLMFHTYGEPDFTEAATAFATDLARAMGTVVVPRGTVRARLAPRWYDDGPRDYVGGLAFLSRDAWIEEHAAGSPAAFVAALERALPDGLVPGRLPALLTTPAVRRNPHVIDALLPRMQPPLDPQTALQVARLLVADDKPERAWALAAGVIREVVGRDLREDRWWAIDTDRPLVRLWIHHDPVGAHRALRHGDDEVRASDDLWAEALDALGRPVQAARVRERHRAAT